MAFKFLQIGKANAEIERLTAELAKVTKEKEDAQAAVADNGNEVAKEAEKLQADLGTAKQSISTLTGERDAAVSQLAGKDAEIKSLTEKLAAKDGEVKIQVARQVAETQSQLGAPPIPAPPKEATATGTNGKGKVGMARVLDLCREDLKKAGYVHPSER